MDRKTVLGKSIKEWRTEFPLLDEIVATQEVFWCNPKYLPFEDARRGMSLTREAAIGAGKRLDRFAPYIARVFPETRDAGGIIESPLIAIPEMKKRLSAWLGREFPGSLLLKSDNSLPVSGSIKARGGIYEVLKHAETLAVDHGMLTEKDDYAIMANNAFRDFFSQYAIAVGSTGNLGLSIGIMSAQLGFKVFVHMSPDAKRWKKDLLRSKGVVVIEHASDYSSAVAAGRQQAGLDANMHFIDDESSVDLFLGYAVAANRLNRQLAERGILVDADHPLFVYLPCGVGGGPGGITFGLKLLFGDHVHCFFAEPTHSPCMLLGLMTGRHDGINVRDFGIDNITAADGLAVGTPSGFVGKTLGRVISGVYTVDDDTLYALLSALADSEYVFLEPSAVAGIPGPARLLTSTTGRQYLDHHSLSPKMERATHVVWATGGSMVPRGIMDDDYKKGVDLLQRTEAFAPFLKITPNG